MAHFEKKKKGHLLYDGKVVKLNVDEVELEDGSSAMREYIRHSGGSTVIAETEDGILFVEQFRYPYGRVVLELPAGKRDGEEDPMLTARRELEEETGYYAKRLTYIGEVYPTPGYSDERIFIYVADGLEKRSAHTDEDEFLSVKVIKADEAAKMVASGEIKDAKTQIAILKYLCFYRAQ